MPTQIPRQKYAVVPALSKIKNPRTVHSTMPRELYNRLAIEAMEMHMSVSGLLCVIVQDYLKRSKARKDYAEKKDLEGHITLGFPLGN